MCRRGLGFLRDRRAQTGDTRRTRGAGLPELSPSRCDKPSRVSLSSPHSSAFFLSISFLFSNPGCILPLNQTICLLALISSNKDSERPKPAGSRRCLRHLREGLGARPGGHGSGRGRVCPQVAVQSSVSWERLGRAVAAFPGVMSQDFGVTCLLQAACRRRS